MAADGEDAGRLAFFEGLLGTSAKLQPRLVAGKGLGVFLAPGASVAEGEVLFGEDPDGLFQMRTQPLACDHCARLLGTLDFQMRLLADSDARPDDGCAGQVALPGIADKSEAQLADARRGWAAWRPEAWFCSEACESAHRTEFGKLLGKEELVRDFVDHAIQCRTPFFVIALRVLLKGSGLLPNLLRRPYWECVDKCEEDPVAQVEEMKADLMASWELLKKMKLVGIIPATMDDYACLVGSLCLNAVAVKYANPLIYYIQEVDQGRGGPEAKETLIPVLEDLRQARLRHAEAVRAAAEVDASESGEASDGADSESDLEDDELQFAWPRRAGAPCAFSTRLFPPMKGYGLYPRLSALNHSCDPNAEVVFAGSSRLLVVARRDLKEGEEVCISYIDHEEEDRAERQKGLDSYGFVCDCSRCRPAKKRRAVRRRPAAAAAPSGQ